MSSTLLLSFVEALAYICAGTFIRATHFSHFIPLSFFPLSFLVNMIFLNSYLLRYSPRAFALLYRYFPLLFRRISFRSHIVVIFLHEYGAGENERLSSQSNSHCLSFLFSISLLFPILFYRFIASRLRASLFVIIFPLFSSHVIFIVPSQLLQSPQYTLQLARQNGFLFPACHTYIRWA